jgi:acyl-CoA thioesterase-1
MIKRSRRLFTVFCCAVILSQPTVFAADKTQANILVLGDSLSSAYGINSDEGWVALLQQQLNHKGYDYRVINASVSGDTTRTGLSRIETALRTHTPEIVIIALGGNDGLRGLAFSEIETSLARIIQRCQQSHAKVLLAGVRLPPNYGPAYTQQFATLYQNLAERHNIPLVPKMLDKVAENRELIQQDGIHPEAEAQPQIMKNIWPGLEPLLVSNKN